MSEELAIRVLTVNQIAELLQVSSTIVRGWITSGMLACYRLGARGCRGAIRVAEADLQEFLAARKSRSRQEPKRPARKINLQNLQLPG
jgi:excisionase family DNA binding protein